MESQTAVKRLSALAQEGRLAAFRLLVQAGRDGMPAGEIARALSLPPNTLSAQLTLLANAGLITGHRSGRSIIYRANYSGMGELLAYLQEDCCRGRPELCTTSLKRLDRADAPGWAEFESALAASGLPRDDLDAPGQSFFRLSGPKGKKAFGGFYRHGADSLLRSIVVPAAARKGGIGSTLVSALLDELRVREVRTAWLLTTDAATFFEKLGFQAEDRRRAPAAIAATAQFAGLCPAGATLMRRDIDHG